MIIVIIYGSYALPFVRPSPKGKMSGLEIDTNKYNDVSRFYCKICVKVALKVHLFSLRLHDLSKKAWGRIFAFCISAA